MSKFEKLEANLSQRGYKVTNVRKHVYAALLDTKVPVTNAQLISQLHSVDKVSIYRTISLFESIGIVHRIWNGFKSSIELSEEFSPHHHHFTCSECGKVISFKDERIEQALHKLENKLGIHIEQHLVEMNGRCKKCNF